MEFRFRASEERQTPWFADHPPRRRLPPPPPPQPMGPFGLFHDQAMQDYVGFEAKMRPRPALELEIDLPIHRRRAIDRLEWELPIRPEPALDEFERELHKERIKEEILARRMARRRMLEEQAWHDIEMERLVMMERFQIERSRKPMGIIPHEDRFGLHLVRRDDELDQEVPLCIGRTRHEFEFEFDEQLAFGGSSKIELVNEPLKTPPPKGSVAGAKRKIAATISGARGAKFQKPERKDWSCSLCQVSTKDEEGLNMHLKGRKHLAKVSGLSSSKNPGGEPSLMKNSSTAQSSSSQHKKGHRGGGKKVQIQIDGKMYDVIERGIFLWCMLCKTKCNSKNVMTDHIRGKKHLSEVSKRKLEETKDAAEQGMLRAGSVTLQN